MSVILYARVSTSKQGEKDLSIPTQLRTLRRLCSERGWRVAGTFTDVASGTSFRGRTGLLSGIERACRDRDVDTLFVHRIDRLARDMFTYLTIKERLLRHGVRIISAVENCEPTPVGQFIERIMAAQAEFYSASLAQQIKGGIEERLRRGKWCGLPPLGYIKKNGEVLVDPARSQFIRLAFERWATGLVGTPALAGELHQAGLVSRHGNQLGANKLCEILHNPFYMGTMLVSGKTYLGVHPPLITAELFDRCQEVFRQKHTGGQPRQHLQFLLSRKLVCPRCMGFLVGEQHRKTKGNLYRYYRCHRAGCRFIIRAEGLEEMARSKLETCNRLAPDQAVALRGEDPVGAKKIFDEVVARVELDQRNFPIVVYNRIHEYIPSHNSMQPLPGNPHRSSQ